MRPYLWPAVLGLIAGVAVFLVALTSGRMAPRLGGQSFAVATTLTGLATNLVLLFVAVFALLVAGAAYREAHDLGMQQQKMFDAERTAVNESRQALGAVVGQLNDNRNALGATLEVLNEHLKTARQALEEERKRASRKPVIDIRVGTITGSQLDSLIRVDIDAHSYTNIDFLVVNTGDADLLAPTVILQAFPSTVFIDQRDVHIPERPDHNVLQLSPGDVPHAGDPARCPVDVRVPFDIGEFHISISVFRQGFSAVTRNFRFAAGRRLRQGRM
jgi:hypothetical protein